MGLKKFWKPPKEASEEKVAQHLREKGVETFDERQTRNKFDSYNVAPVRVRRQPELYQEQTSALASAPLASTPTDPYSLFAREHGDIEDDLNRYESEDLNTYVPEEQDHGATDLEREIDKIEKQIRDARIDTFKSSEATKQHLEGALETGIQTTGMLASQGERLYTTRNRVDVLEKQQTAAHESIEDLRWNDRSIFSTKVRAPVKRRQAREFVDVQKQNLLRVKGERAVRDEKFRSGQSEIEQLLDEVKRHTRQDDEEDIEEDLNRPPPVSDRRARLAAVQNMMLSYKQDEEAEDLELKISSNLDRTLLLAQNLNKLSKGMTSELERQKEYISELGTDMDKSSAAIDRNNKELNDTWLKKKKKKDIKQREFEKFDDDDDDIDDYEDKLDRFLGDGGYQEDSDKGFGVRKVVKKML